MSNSDQPRASQQDEQPKVALQEEKSNATGAANILIDIATTNTVLFHDERQLGYALVTEKAVQKVLKIESTAFRRWLVRSFFDAKDGVPNKDALNSAVSLLDAKAMFDGEMRELFNRFAMWDGSIYIDMTDSSGRVVQVSPSGWKVMNKPPVLFKRYAHQKPLPDPVRGGKLSNVHRYLNIKEDDDKLLIEAWLVACAFPNVPRPVLGIHGSQGSSKTTAARVVKRLVDPALTDSVCFGKSEAELAQILDHHAVPCFDNLTSIQNWAADMLCRGVTGGSFSKRQHYSDDGDVIFTFKRPMIITGINIPTNAPDLLERLLLIELKRLSPDKRIDETTFLERFDAEESKLFGALLDGIAGALKHLPSIKLRVMPRMADFTRIACAYAEWVGIGAERMLDVIMRHTARQTLEVLDADPVASGVRDFMHEKQPWTGTATELLALLTKAQGSPLPFGWPKEANILMKKLNLVLETLDQIGIRVTKSRDGQKRDRVLWLENKSESSSASSASSQPTIQAHPTADAKGKPSSLQKFRTDAVCDDADDMDDGFTILSGPVVEAEI